MPYENGEILETILSDVVENHIVKHQLDSFNNYINCELNSIIRIESSIRLKYDDRSIVISLSGALRLLSQKTMEQCSQIIFFLAGPGTENSATTNMYW